MQAGTGTAGLSSTTAPGKVFGSRAELADHYKSDWHKYNLKRREAGLPLLGEQDFQARWEAALALRAEKEKKNGTDHLKANKKKGGGNSKLSKKNQEINSTGVSSVANDSLEQGNDMSSVAATPKTPKETAESQENPDIDPKQSLFDQHISNSVEENVKYMQTTYGFFLPDQEHLTDLEGLVGYCHEKIKLGHYCLYCEKMFPTWQGCQKHMINKQHAKLKYEATNGAFEELEPFYDFSDENQTFLASAQGKKSTKNEEEDVIMEDDGDEEWEDMSDGEAQEAEDLQEYEDALSRFGFDVTPLGELVLPDGRIIGHRGLQRYYKQHFRSETNSTAIVAAKTAAGERMYEGTVVNIGAGIQRPDHGAGKGVLVRQRLADGAVGFSALSLYRYRAVVKKQRRDDTAGLRLKYRQAMNMNKMDKKANRIMNGVSVAHAKR